MNYHKLNKLEAIALLGVCSAILLLIGYNVGLSAKTCSGDLQRMPNGHLYCDLGKIAEDDVK